MTLTKADIIDALVQRIGLNRRESLELVEGFFNEISKSLERGEEVKLSGFGSFQVRGKPARTGRNPRTGEPATITARRVVTFHPSAKLLQYVDGELTSKGSSELETLLQAIDGASEDGRQLEIAEG